MTLDQYLTMKRITAAEFARDTRLSRQQVSRYRRGETLPRPRPMAVIRRASGGLVGPEDWYPEVRR